MIRRLWQRWARREPDTHLGPLTISVGKAKSGAVILRIGVSKREVVAILPRASALALVDELLDVLQIGGDDEPEPGPATVQ